MVEIDKKNLRMLQMIELEMLLEVDRICQKHDIPYNIIGGTLLGSVRHKGFIPWDDDADLTMMRKDYQRFRRICRRELDSSKYYFQDAEVTTGYRWSYGKLRRKDTLFLREYQEHMPYEQGVFIDIFPVDHVPDAYLLRAVYNFLCFCIRKILWSEVGQYQEQNILKRNVYRLLSRIPKKDVIGYYMRMVHKQNATESRYARIGLMPVPGKSFGYPKKWYTQSADYMFEGYTLKGVRDAHDFLTFIFGDYMELPQKKNRKVHPVSRLELFENELYRQDVQKRTAQNPLLSVIIPVYHAAAYLERCIKSVREQSYQNLEIILVNDGSVDGSAQMCDQYAKEDQRIKVIHKENGGQVSARKAGLKIASGEYIAYMDADDWIETEMYNDLMQLMIDADADLVTSGFIRDYATHCIRQEEEIPAGVYEKEKLVKGFLQQMVATEVFFKPRVCFTPWNKIYKKNLLRIWQNKVNDCINVGEEVAFLLPYFLHVNKIVVSGKNDYHYCIRNDSTMCRNKENGWQGCQTLLKYLREECRKHENRVRNITDQQKWIAYYYTLLQCADRVLRYKNGILFPFGEIGPNDKVIIYGAGRFGCELKRVLEKEYSFEIAAWVDKAAKDGVQGVECLDHVRYDKILLAVLVADITKEIRENLIKRGIEEEKILQVDMGLLERVCVDVAVSVVIPVCNAEKYLEECLQSVIRQTLQNIEIICVDDGSQDQSLSILKAYAKKDARIIVLQERHQGAAAARNLGMTYARGEYVCFLDSDDIFETDMLEILYKSAKAHQAQIAFCGYDSDLEKTDCHLLEKIEKKTKEKYARNTFCMEDLTYDGFLLWGIPAWTRLFSCDFIRRCGLRFQEIDSSNDIYFSIMSMVYADRMVQAYDFKPMVHYRKNTENQISAGRKIKNAYLAWLKVYEDMKQYQVSRKRYHQFYAAVLVNLIAELHNVSESMEDKKKFYDFFAAEGMRQLGLEHLLQEHGMEIYKNLQNCFRTCEFESGWYQQKEQVCIRLEAKGPAQIRSMCQEKKVAIWGAGKYGTSILEYFKHENIRLPKIIDSDVKKQNMHIYDQKVYAYHELKGSLDIIIITSKIACNSICADICKENEPNVKILPLFLWLDTDLELEECMFKVAELLEGKDSCI